MTTINNIPDILKNIIARKHQEIIENKKIKPLSVLMEESNKAPKTRGFYDALVAQTSNKNNAVIAEIKKASPSKGLLRQDFDPVAIAKSYEKFGATCLSVLTDKDFFQGDNSYLSAVKNTVNIPILRKDFIIDEYQVFEARAIGADCILLIASCLDNAKLQDLSAIATQLSMDVLIEVHNLDELRRVLKFKLPMIGINNRNLRSFDVSLQTTIELLKEINNDMLVITESGILTKEDVTLMRQHNIYSYLVGEAFMRQAEPGKALAEMFK